MGFSAISLYKNPLDFRSLLWYVVCYPTERSVKMIDRITRNAEIFRNIEWRYKAFCKEMQA